MSRSHLFQKGVSGNPSGRPKGITNFNAIAKADLAKHKTTLLNKSIEMAMNGSESMMKLLLDRLLPIRPKDDPIQIDMSAGSDTGMQSQEILQRIYDGDITPLQGLSALQSVLSHDTVKNNSDAVRMALEIASSKK